VLGFFDVLKNLPKFFKLKDLILKKLSTIKPDAIIFVDFSGFNLRLAKELNNTLPTLYFISPQVWASRKGRVKTIKQFISKMIVLFKFEETFYKKHGINVDFVGHPLLDIIKPSQERKDFLRKFNLCPDKTTVAFLPGSRKAEVAKILPVMLEAAGHICKKLPHVQFVIAKSPNVDWELYLRRIKKSVCEIEVIEGKTYDCLNAADFCLVASGTATLETAIMEKPFAVIYKMGVLNYLLYRPQVKVPYIGIVNIVAGKGVVPEFIQFKANPKKISDFVLENLKDREKLKSMKNNLAEIKKLLGEKGASKRAAKIVVDFLKQPATSLSP
jgi:lipid-A-disaccharide synthase